LVATKSEKEREAEKSSAERQKLFPETRDFDGKGQALAETGERNGKRHASKGRVTKTMVRKGIAQKRKKKVRKRSWKSVQEGRSRLEESSFLQNKELASVAQWYGPGLVTNWRHGQELFHGKTANQQSRDMKKAASAANNFRGQMRNAGSKVRRGAGAKNRHRAYKRPGAKRVLGTADSQKQETETCFSETGSGSGAAAENGRGKKSRRKKQERGKKTLVDSHEGQRL